MTDDQQRARELLAQEYERDGIAHIPDCIRREAMLTEMEHRAVRAIAAALRAAPEGFVMVPVEPTEEMVESAEMAETRHVIENRKRRGNDPEMSYQGIYRAMLAARPQEASDAN